MKDKILIVASWYPSADNAIRGIFIQDQALTLARKCEVAVLVPYLASWFEIPKRGLRRISRTEEREGLSVYREEAPIAIPRVPLLSEWSLALGIAGLAKRGFKRVMASWGKPDLIHAHVVLPAGWAAVSLKQKYSIPVVLTEHSGPFAMHLRTGRQRRLVRKTLAQVDRIVAVSPAMAQQIRDFQPDVEPIVIGEVVKTELFEPLESKRPGLSGACRFLSVALLGEQKGFVYLLEAAKALLQRGLTSFELIIGGDGPQRPQLEQAVRTLGLSNHCRFLGMLSPTQVKYWMQQCDVFVLPSLHETFGIVLGEAMACGKPVIATRCGGPEFIVVPETGELVEPANSQALADAMARSIQGQVKYDPQAVRRSVVERFGEKVFLEKISAVYEQL